MGEGKGRRHTKHNLKFPFGVTCVAFEWLLFSALSVSSSPLECCAVEKVDKIIGRTISDPSKGPENLIESILTELHAPLDVKTLIMFAHFLRDKLSSSRFASRVCAVKHFYKRQIN